MHYDVAGLLDSLDRIPATSWQQPSDYAATGVHHGYSRVALFRGRTLLPTGEAFRWVLDDFAPLRDAFLSRTEPGGFIVPHRDPGPHYERWHVPIVTAGVWVDDEREWEPQVGVPFAVEHWASHAVWNNTTEPRIHLVIDRDVLLHAQHPDRPFRTYPVPERYAQLVHAIGGTTCPASS